MESAPTAEAVRQLREDALQLALQLDVLRGRFKGLSPAEDDRLLRSAFHLKAQAMDTRFSPETVMKELVEVRGVQLVLQRRKDHPEELSREFGTIADRADVLREKLGRMFFEEAAWFADPSRSSYEAVDRLIEVLMQNTKKKTSDTVTFESYAPE